MSSAIVQATGWNESQIQTLKNQVAKGCSDEELALFGQVCQKTGLDPFTRQIYAVPMGGKMTIQVGIDGLRTIADRSGKYAGSQTFWCGEDGVWEEAWLRSDSPMAAKTIVYKTNGGGSGFVGVALMSEFNQGKGLWSKMPVHMIGKVSEAAALRKAFPAELSGLYTDGELPESVPTVDAEVVSDEREALLARAKELGQSLNMTAAQQGDEVAKVSGGDRSAKKLSLHQLQTLVLNLESMAIPA